MSVVVSDTSPLHYLILCDAENILPRLFRQVVIPPTVFRELQQPNTRRLFASGRLRYRSGFQCNRQKQ